MRIKITVLSISLIVGLSFYSSESIALVDGLNDPYTSEYVIAQDTIPIRDRSDDFINDPSRNPFDLRDPSVIEQNVEYDPTTGNYIITERIGEDFYRAPTYMTFDEYLEWRSKQQERNYFDRLNGVSGIGEAGSIFDDPIEGIDIKSSIVDRLFGGSDVTIRPQGSIDLTFGLDFQKTANPALPLRAQRNGGFDFDMDIQMSVDGQIGEKLKLGTNYNTQATFDFENQLKLEYDSENFGEDDIIKNIDAGNISFPLNSSLIKGSQSLFGIRTDLQFGRLKLSLVASQQKSQQQSIDLQGGDQLQYFEVRADEYEENRHFFFTHYNRSVFKESLRNLPQISNLFRVTKIEVYVTNSRNETEGGIRDILAFTDLGEPEVITNPNVQAPPVPSNRDIFQRALPGREITNGPGPYANDLLGRLQADENIRDVNRSLAILTGPRFRMQQNRDFEKVQARKLGSSEYTFHPELGILSINAPIQPTDVIAMSMEYDYNGKTYKIGEFGNDVYDPDSSASIIYTKLLKSTTQQVSAPTWDLMLKNVYNIGAFQVDRKDFLLDIYYNDPGAGDKRFLPATNLEGVPLLQVFNLDNLNAQGDPCPDGRFDYVSGLTIQPRNGRIMFPVLEPFGSDLKDKITDKNLANQYVFQELYDTTVTAAREVSEKNRYIIRGSYKSGGSGGPGGGVNLRSFNLPRGGVRVIAGGQELVEGVDYTVDYNTGSVTVSDAIRNSGLNYRVEYEDNSLFGFQTKTLLGARADFALNKKTNIGATWMHLFERPFTQKVNVGEDPLSNGIFGLDLNYSSDAPWLTRLVDKIPGINTKEPSSVTLSAEAAISRPGHAKAINIGKTRDGKTDKSGALYLDDFEGSTSGFDLRVPNNRWVLASVPQSDNRNSNPLLTIMVVGQVNAGKSSLVNALLEQSVAEVDLIAATEGFHPYQLSLAEDVEIILMDTPGLDGTKANAAALLEEASSADLLLWLSQANQPAKALDKQLMDEWDQYFNANLDRKKPPVLLVTTHNDMLKPQHSWQPPYDLDDVENAKAQSIVAASRYTRETLGLADDNLVVPIALRPDEMPYNVDVLRDMLVTMSSEARAAQLNRERLDASRSMAIVSKTLSQTAGLAGEGIKLIFR